MSGRHAAPAPYTLSELMITAAAHEIQDGEHVFVGMRLPLAAFVVAKRTKAPRAVGVFEVGVVRDTAPAEMIYTMSDPPNIRGALQCLDTMSVMSLLQSGRVDIGFLGAAEVDKFGNLNSTQVRGAGGQLIRLPGSGGACDIASLAHRFVDVLEHRKHRLPERVAYITSPGYGDGPGWRERVGLPRGGPSAVITTKAVLRFGDDCQAYLASVHPGVPVDEVVKNTGWPLRVDGVQETAAPTAEELTALRNFDKEGFWAKL